MENAIEASHNEWYDLREHIDDLTKEYVRFKFSESNAPNLNSEIWERLKRNFKSLTIDRPLEEMPMPFDKPYREYRSGGWLYITLEFTDAQSRLITDDMVRKLTNTMHP